MCYNKRNVRLQFSGFHLRYRKVNYLAGNITGLMWHIILISRSSTQSNSCVVIAFRIGLSGVAISSMEQKAFWVLSLWTGGNSQGEVKLILPLQLKLLNTKLEQLLITFQYLISGGSELTAMMRCYTRSRTILSNFKMLKKLEFEFAWDLHWVALCWTTFLLCLKLYIYIWTGEVYETIESSFVSLNGHYFKYQFVKVEVQSD